MMCVVVWLMILLIPGLIGALAFECACKHKIKCCFRFISAALIFDLLALIINLLWIRFIKIITDFDVLMRSFCCLSFTAKFAILNIILCIILGLLFGLICKCLHKKHHIFIQEEKE